MSTLLGRKISCKVIRARRQTNSVPISIKKIIPPIGASSNLIGGR